MPNPKTSTLDSGEFVIHKVTISHIAQATHDGKRHYMNHSGSMDADDEQDYLIIAPTGTQDPMHYVPMPSTNKEIKLEIFRSPTIVATSMGTLMTVFNHKDTTAATTSNVVGYHTPTVSTTGTLLLTQIHGSGPKGGGASFGADEKVFLNGKEYLVRLTAAGNTTNFAMEHDWHEEIH